MLTVDFDNLKHKYAVQIKKKKNWTNWTTGSGTVQRPVVLRVWQLMRS